MSTVSLSLLDRYGPGLLSLSWTVTVQVSNPILKHLSVVSAPPSAFKAFTYSSLSADHIRWCMYVGARNTVLETP
jgi:hypothetical protein